jgi:dTMP kinase
MIRKGCFVCIEGLDGSGKSTQARLLAERLQKTRKVLLTVEPSQGRIGTFIRQSYLYGENRLSSVVEALLFAADRVDHVQNEIVPALETGDVVISDRYVYSSLAYQGAAGLSLEWIEKVNSHALRPDIALFLDVDLGTVMKRLKPRKSVMENLETQERVRGYYLDLVKVGLLRRVDGNRVKSEIAEETFSIVQDFLVSRA